MSWLMNLPAIVAISVLLPLVYLWWLKRADGYEPLRTSDLMKAYLSGATLGVIGGALLTLIFIVPIAIIFPWIDDTTLILITAIIMAPIAEEAMKGACVLFFRSKLEKLENGILLGAAIGLGFATTENVIYGISAASDGLYIGVFLVGVRSVTAAFAHSSFTGITGYGLARWRRGGVSDPWWPFYLLAVSLHGFFNLVASFTEISEISLFLQVSTTIVLGMMTFTMFYIMRKRVSQIDELEKNEDEKGIDTPSRSIYPGGSNP